MSHGPRQHFPRCYACLKAIRTVFGGPEWHRRNDPPGGYCTCATPTLAPLPLVDHANGLAHCSPQCPHLVPDPTRMCQGTCRRDGQPLDFHDFYLARCAALTASTEPT